MDMHILLTVAIAICSLIVQLFDSVIQSTRERLIETQKNVKRERERERNGFGWISKIELERKNDEEK